MFTPVKIVRFWLPLVIFVVGLGMLVISPDIVGVEGAALMVGGGLGVVVSNRIHRMGLAGERDRDAEMDARRFFDRYGVWPDEASPEQLAEAEQDPELHGRPTGAAADAADGPDAGPSDGRTETPATADPHRRAHPRRADGPGRSRGRTRR